MSYQLSDKIKLILKDDDELWPTTMAGHFRVVTQKHNHNVLGEGEHNVSEMEMIEGVLNQGLASRWRSKTNDKRKTPNHFSIGSPSVREVYVKVGEIWVKHK